MLKFFIALFFILISFSSFASDEIWNSLRDVYKYPGGDFLDRPEDISYFSKYRCTSENTKNYNMSIPSEILIYFSEERYLDWEWEDVTPDTEKANNEIDMFDQRREEAALEKAEDAQDPRIQKVIDLWEKAQTAKIPMERAGSVAESNILIRQIARDYGYTPTVKTKLVQTENYAFNNSMVVKGEVSFNFNGNTNSFQVYSFWDNLTSIYDSELEGWNSLGRRYSVKRGFPLPPLMPDKGKFLNLYHEKLNGVDNFSVEVKQYDEYTHKIKEKSMRHGLHISTDIAGRPDTFKAQIYFGIYNSELEWETLKNYTNAPIPAMAYLDCQKEHEDELADEASSKAWLLANNFSIEDFRNGKYAKRTEDVLANDDKKEIDDTSTEQTYEDWHVLTSEAKSIIIKEHRKIVALAAVGVSLSAGAKALNKKPNLLAYSRALKEVLKTSAKKLPIIGSLVTFSSILMAQEHVEPPCISPDLYTNVQSLSINSLKSCLKNDPKLAVDFYYLKQLLNFR